MFTLVMVTASNVCFTGQIPDWLNGKLVRIGPGLFEIGANVARYPMDGMGLLHAISIQNGEASFQSKSVLNFIIRYMTGVRHRFLVNT